MKFSLGPIGLSVAATLLAAGCSHSPGAAALPNIEVQEGVGHPAVGVGDVVVKLPPVVPASPQPGIFKRGLSPSTLSLSWSFASSKLRRIALNPQTQGCTTIASGLTCTLVLAVPAGKGMLSLQTYATANGSGKPLATASEAATVFAGQKNIVAPPKFLGLATRFILSITPSSLTQGVPADVAIALDGIDASGAVVPSPAVLGPDGKPVRWVAQAQGPYAASLFPVLGIPHAAFTPVTLSYDGRLAGVERIILSAARGKASYPSGSISIAAGPTAPASIFVWNGFQNSYNPVSPPSALEQFSASASGNAAPLRTYQLGGPALLAESDGSFWSGPIGLQSGSAVTNWIEQYLVNGKGVARLKPVPGRVFGSVAFDIKQNLYAAEAIVKPGLCYNTGTIDVYSAASSWTKLTRQLDVSFGYSLCTAPLAADSSGNVFIVDENGNRPRIDEYAAGYSGKVKPSQVFTLGYNQTVRAMVTDSNGNLFAVVDGQVLELSSSSLPASHPFAITNASGVAMDAQNTLYVTTYAFGSTPASIAEYPRGASTPALMIAGPSTGLTSPSGIAVVP
jgi:hypothetical protein